MRAHQPTTTAAVQEAAQDPGDASTAFLPAGRASASACQKILGLIVEFPVNQRLVTSFTWAQTLHKPGVNLVGENREHLARCPRLRISRYPAERVGAGGDHERRDPRRGPSEHPHDGL